MILKKYLVTNKGNLKASIVVLLLIFAYFTEKYVIPGIDKYVFTSFFTKPILWLILAYLIWVFPRGRFQGKYRLRNFINTLAFLCGGFHIFFMLAGGFIDGFGKSPYSFAFFGIITNFFYVFSVILAKELFRAYLVNNSTLRNSHQNMAFTSILFTFLSLSITKIMSLDTMFEVIKYSGNTVLPIFSENIFTTYLTYLGGPMPAIIYQGVLKGFQWFCPILPNLGWMSKTLLGTLVPFISLIIVQQLYLLETRKIRNNSRNKENTLGWLGTCVLAVLIVWFSVGLFPIYPKVVLTGSMKPLIEPGDVVVLKKTDTKDIKVGDIIQFHYENMDIIHRVIEINQGEQIMYKTKGDNNSSADSDFVSPQQIEGRLIKIVPKIGIPSLILRSNGGITSQNVEI